MKGVVLPGNENWSGGCAASVLLHANPIGHLAGAYADPPKLELKRPLCGT